MSDNPFSNDPRTRWLTEDGEDRQMELLEAFSYTDRKTNKVWTAPANREIDGASIPRALWTLAGSPYTGDYRRASIVHDIACVEAGTDRRRRRAADKMFFNACKDGGCSTTEAMILYLGVRIGAILPFVPQWEPTSQDSRPRLSRLPSELRLELDFQHAGEMMLEPGETDDVDELESRVDQALASVTLLDTSRL